MILDNIVNQVNRKLAQRKSSYSEQRIDEDIFIFERFPQHRFINAVRRVQGTSLKIIAEIKKASPSRGIIRKNFDPLGIAQIYTDLNVDAISVLTEPDFFQGSLDYLKCISERFSTPLLRKDFIVDSYQIKEALLNGASAVLLIASILSAEQLRNFITLCDELTLDYILEVHDENDLDKAIKVNPAVIGINNRDLKTFHVDIRTTERLKKNIPAGTVIIGESGVHAETDVQYLNDLGIDAVLIGEGLMKYDDVKSQFHSLFGVIKS
ncbi:MAG: indole-3-glycerol phosphate synthase TrpC [Candidatus Auribacterota bacterium]